MPVMLNPVQPRYGIAVRQAKKPDSDIWPVVRYRAYSTQADMEERLRLIGTDLATVMDQQQLNFKEPPVFPDSRNSCMLNIRLVDKAKKPVLFIETKCSVPKKNPDTLILKSNLPCEKIDMLLRHF